jgi:hypothetical protein
MKLLKEYINLILQENKEYKTKLYMFDFDDTLFRSPQEPERYNGSYWWNSAKSLEDTNENMWIEKTVNKARLASEDKSILSIMCTARQDRPEIVFSVNSLLRDKGLYFDKLFYKNINTSTSEYKAETIGMMLDAYPNVDEVHVWEDNQENIQAIKEKCERLNVKFFGNLVNV